MTLPPILIQAELDSGDTQLATYFIETDVVITADKALLEILEEYRPYAPCRLPEGCLKKLSCRAVQAHWNVRR